MHPPSSIYFQLASPLCPDTVLKRAGSTPRNAKTSIAAEKQRTWNASMLASAVYLTSSLRTDRRAAPQSPTALPREPGQRQPRAVRTSGSSPLPGVASGRHPHEARSSWRPAGAAVSAAGMLVTRGEWHTPMK